MCLRQLGALRPRGEHLSPFPLHVRGSDHSQTLKTHPAGSGHEGHHELVHVSTLRTPGTEIVRVGEHLHHPGPRPTPYQMGEGLHGEPVVEVDGEFVVVVGQDDPAGPVESRPKAPHSG